LTGRNEAAKQHYKEFAILNFPNSATEVTENLARFRFAQPQPKP
jgi:hypothetical protein